MNKSEIAERGKFVLVADFKYCPFCGDYAGECCGECEGAKSYWSVERAIAESQAWISVKEKLPPESDMYIVAAKPAPTNEVSTNIDIFSAVWEDDVLPGEPPRWLGVNDQWIVTHWQPLPNPPKGNERVELGDGEPSSSLPQPGTSHEEWHGGITTITAASVSTPPVSVPYTTFVSTEPLDVIRANECEARDNLATSRFRALWNEIVRLRSGAAQEVSPSANFVSEIRPRPDDPSCHVCGARMVVKEWKCLSCKATTGVEEVSPLSEYEQQAAGFANYALEVKGLLTEEFGEHFPEDIPAVVEILAQTEDFLKRGKFGAEGDTRELKAALRKALLIHWLSQIECNHEEKNDSAICACGWKSERGFNVGNAVELWIDHVFTELG